MGEKLMAETILVVDDQSSVRQLLQEYLTEQGFQVLTAADGQAALHTARRQPPDLILLDLMMPKMDGYQFLRIFRRERQTPVIIVTAREEETDAVVCLDMGADDYIVKPFRMRELAARILAVLRRSRSTNERGKILRGGAVELDQESHTVTVKGELVCLTPIEFDLLAILMGAPGLVFKRDQLIENLAGSGFSGMSRTLNVHIRNLRTKIETQPGDPRCIETVFGIGYRFHKAL
jgi:two-component system, OmpR family, alkaline phosphatase synthesis response regulator PhoP